MKYSKQQLIDRLTDENDGLKMCVQSLNAKINGQAQNIHLKTNQILKLNAKVQALQEVVEFVAGLNQRAQEIAPEDSHELP